MIFFQGLLLSTNPNLQPLEIHWLQISKFYSNLTNVFKILENLMSPCHFSETCSKELAGIQVGPCYLLFILNLNIVYSLKISKTKRLGGICLFFF